MTLVPEQARAGRALVNWSQADLAKAAGISRATLAEFEANKRVPIPNNLDAIQRALETAGVIFIEGDDEGPGVRLRKDSPQAAE